ncbi:hypothetical protein BLNAU_180 [Blattamonas nauphoetae]|uniref:Uncharacterized protein n=1 Tax=Blattamonas nauphoetae TaxID=2049346 RepID=A0ABQ9YMU2_9EUKA|nr:hypothetical protein BLNAU_180 [Blattamonas nauphoetae]
MSTSRQSYLQSTYTSNYGKHSASTQQRSGSPVKTKIEMLTSRLGSIQQNLAEDRTIKYQSFEQELAKVSEDLKKIQKTGDEEISNLNEEIERMRISLEHAMTEREALQHKLDEDTVVVEDLLHQAIQREQQEGEQALSDALQMAQDQLVETQNSVSELLSDRTDKMRDDYSALLEQIPILQEKMKEEREAEDLFVQQLEEKLKSEVAQLKQSIEQERSLRKKLEEDALKSLDEFSEFAQSELHNERTDREQTEQALFKLWDQTCKKIQDARAF